MPPSKSLAKRPAAPLAPVDYRLGLTRRSVAVFVWAGFTVAFLVFVSGLVVGVALDLGGGNLAAAEEGATGVVPSGLVLPAGIPGVSDDSGGVTIPGFALPGGEEEEVAEGEEGAGYDIQGAVRARLNPEPPAEP